MHHLIIVWICLFLAIVELGYFVRKKVPKFLQTNTVLETKFHKIISVLNLL